MSYETAAEWLFAFNAAALDLLAAQTTIVCLDDFRLEARACATHDSGCVHVICGELLEHLAWRQVDPAALAEVRFREMQTLQRSCQGPPPNLPAPACLPPPEGPGHSLAS